MASKAIIISSSILLAIYLSIFISSVHYYESLPSVSVPDYHSEHSLNLTQALGDLQSITTRPHSFNSRANDAVRSFILSRLSDINGDSRTLTIQDDMFSNVTWYEGRGAVRYFEGSNILVKIEGSNPALKAVLFSAHYDSVSTAYGATDDGMGVVTLLQLITYFSKNRPSRSVVFNINNGEEDGLHGSRAFLNHPWSKEIGFFLNLEGAGSGGVPIVFRTSSYDVTQALKTTSRPHGSVFSSDTFALGLIRSRTDYSVYTAAGMSGLDFAFYQRRSHYHTMKDTISNLNGPGSLWRFMDSSLSIGRTLEQTNSSGTEHKLPLHFDLFARYLVLFTLENFYICNLVLLALGAIIYVLHIYYVSSPSVSRLFAKDAIYFLAICLFSITMSVALCSIYLLINPYIVHSSKYLVAVSVFILTFVSINLPLSYISERIPDIQGIILYELNLFWWLLLLLNTVFLTRRGIGGLYFVTFFYGASLLALVIFSLDRYSFKGAVAPAAESASNDQNETTPLLPQEQTQPNEAGRFQKSKHIWMILLCVPAPLILTTQIAVILLHALSQTLPDGGSSTFVYAAIALLGFLLVLPLTPFVSQIHRNVSFASLLLLLLLLAVNLLSPPFTEEAPLKVFFYQAVNLTEQSSQVQLIGIEGYVQQLVDQLPLTWQRPVLCEVEPSTRLTRCKWNSTTSITKDMVSLDTKVIRSGQATFTIKGQDTRFCRIRFDRPVLTFHVNETGTGKAQPGYSLPSNGITELQLWSHERSKTFVVDVSWPKDETLHGRVSCGWNDAEDWESRIPAFKEILDFLPSWSVVSKSQSSLIEASLEFSL